MTNDGRPISEFEVVSIGGDGFLAHKSSAFAVNMIKSYKGASTLESAIAGIAAKDDAERNKILSAALTKIIELKKAGKTLDDSASELEKQFFTVDAAILEKFSAGSLQDSSFYAQSVRGMSKQ